MTEEEEARAAIIRSERIERLEILEAKLEDDSMTLREMKELMRLTLFRIPLVTKVTASS